jgi:hypothetical protein
MTPEHFFCTRIICHTQGGGAGGCTLTQLQGSTSLNPLPQTFLHTLGAEGFGGVEG